MVVGMFHARAPRRLQLRPLVLLALLALRSPCPGSSLSLPFPSARIRLNGVEHYVRDTGEPAIARNTTHAAPVAVCVRKRVRLRAGASAGWSGCLALTRKRARVHSAGAAAWLRRQHRLLGGRCAAAACGRRAGHCHRPRRLWAHGATDAPQPAPPTASSRPGAGRGRP